MKVKVLAISFVLSFFSLLAVRLVGIDWDYHVDSVTYISESAMISDLIISSGDPMSYLNSGFYLWVNLLRSNVALLNVSGLIFYSLANYLIYDAVSFRLRPFTSQARILAFLLPLFLFPYSLYLATAILKDGFNLFLLSLIFSNYIKNKTFFGVSSVVSFLALICIRLQSAALFLICLKPGRKPMSIIVYTFSLVIFLSLLNYYLEGNILGQIVSANDVDMRFRSFDTVPSFREYGLAGVLLRMLVWPLLSSSGLFVVLSLSPEFILAGLGFISLFFCSFVNSGKLIYINFSAYLLLSLIASQATGFTSYIRYAFPICFYSYLFVGLDRRVQAGARCCCPLNPSPPN